MFRRREFSYVAKFIPTEPGEPCRSAYFFTETHDVPDGLGDSWVPCTVSLPMNVAPRESCPTGIVSTREEYVRVFLENDIEITPDQAVNY